MEPLLLGLSAPSIATTAGAVGRAVKAVAKPLASPFALLLQSHSQPTVSAKPQAVELADLETRADEFQNDLEGRMLKVIEESGVELDSQVRLRISEFDGTLEADALASPQREILEAALASNPSLADDFRQLAAVRNLLAAADRHEEFAAAYAHDPERALAAYGSRIDESFEAVLNLRAAEDNPRLEFEKSI